MTEETLLALLTEKFTPHTVLLYGSRARADATPQSDWDVACLAPVDEARHHGWVEDGAFLDVFVYPAFEAPTPEGLRMLGSRVLRDEQGLAGPFLAQLAALDARGPLPMPAHQRAMERTWIAKMVARVGRSEHDPGDLEAHYRRHWLLKDLLEYAFTLQNKWFRGPKTALLILQKEDPPLFALFAEALAPHASLASITRLATAIAEIEAE